MVAQERVVVHDHETCILIVEDDPDIQEMLQTLLQTEGYRTVMAGSGEEGLRLLDGAQIDLVVLDLHLPGMHGYEVCRQIRARGAAEMPILMLTADQTPAGAAAGLRLGADDYLRKPFEPDELRERMEALLRRRQAREELVTENRGLQQVLESVQREAASARQLSDTERVLRREFLHNVVVHLRALCGVIEAEYRRAPLGPAREVTQRVLNRTRGAALVYETSELLQDDPARIDEIVHAIALALKQIYSPRKRLPLEVEGGPLELPLVYAAPLAMIANELITNAFKHAFPDQRFGGLWVRYGVDGDEVLLEVRDDGIGMQRGAGRGRGLAAVEQLAAGMGGTAAWDSGANGTTATVRLPIRMEPEGTP